MATRHQLLDPLAGGAGLLTAALIASWPSVRAKNDAETVALMSAALFAVTTALAVRRLVRRRSESVPALDEESRLFLRPPHAALERVAWAVGFVALIVVGTSGRNALSAWNISLLLWAPLPAWSVGHRAGDVIEIAVSSMGVRVTELTKFQPPGQKPRVRETTAAWTAVHMNFNKQRLTVGERHFSVAPLVWLTTRNDQLIPTIAARLGTPVPLR